MAGQNDTRTFLNVSRSVTGRRWVDALTERTANVARAISQRHELPDLIGRVLAARDVPLEDAEQFLNPSLRDLMPDPARLADMDMASNRLATAITNGEKVAIFGDYDVDGATSSALLGSFLRYFRTHFNIHIPDRIFEGYGPNIKAIDQLIEQGAQLIVTVDCGSTSFEAVKHARSRDCDLIVLDHHQLDETLPVANAVVNPNRQDDVSGQGHLAAVGVVFLTLVATLRNLRDAGVPEAKNCDLLQWLDLVALGTVCDVVPLRGLNRAYVTKGLIAIRHGRNRGLLELAKTARLNGPASAYHLGFLLGPRINAGGRIGDASLGARLLLEERPEEATRIAEELDRLNSERQTMETEMLAEAISQAEREIGFGEGPPVLIAEKEDWHPGVVGLLAARLKERFNRPAIAISFNAQGVGTGSARSVSGVDLGAAVRAALGEDLIVKGGGHAMAAGITIARDKLGAFRAFMESRLIDDVNRARQQDALRIDAALLAEGANVKLMDLIEQVGPFGSGHSQPIFALPSHYAGPAKIVGNGHIRLSVSAGQGPRLNAIAFRAADTPLGDALLNNARTPKHFAGTLSLDHWGGRPSVQFRILDVAEVTRR